EEPNLVDPQAPKATRTKRTQEAARKDDRAQKSTDRQEDDQGVAAMEIGEADAKRGDLDQRGEQQKTTDHRPKHDAPADGADSFRRVFARERIAPLLQDTAGAAHLVGHLAPEHAEASILLLRDKLDARVGPRALLLQVLVVLEREHTRGDASRRLGLSK